MEQPGPHYLESGELLLQGRLQIDTAVQALTVANTYPAGVTQLNAILQIHDTNPDDDGQGELTVYVSGQKIRRLKTAIITGLRLMEQTALPDQKVAASELLEILGITPPS